MTSAPPPMPPGTFPVKAPPGDPTPPMLSMGFDWKHVALAFLLGWIVGRRRSP